MWSREIVSVPEVTTGAEAAAHNPSQRQQPGEWRPLHLSSKLELQPVSQPDPEDIGDPALAWQRSALCKQTDPEAFFPEEDNSKKAAKRICSLCVVKSECLEYALTRDEKFGIWGGLSALQRRRLKRESA